MSACNGDQEKNNVTLLLEILSDEIARDGGISLVKEIPLYIGKNRLHSLLKPKKLLAFLEQHSNLFQVSNRTVSPHVVQLISKEYCKGTAPQHKDHSRKVLDDRVLSTLKKETLRIKRRGKSQIFPGFKIVWLLKQCKYELHYHLRDLGWYFEQNKPLLLGSEAWFESVQNKFCQIVQNSCDIVDERLYLRQSIKDSTAITRKTTIICEIIKTLEIDGGTHLSHSLLMHRYPHLRALLSGYDLRQLLDDDHEFLEVSIRNQEIFFNLRQDDYSSEKRALLQVDETGLFSVTSSKYAKAFANFLLRYASDSTSVAVDLTASVGGLTLALAKQPRISHVIAIEIDPHRSELCRQNMQIHNASHKVEVRTQDSYQILAELSQELKEEQEIIMALDPPWGGIHYKENPQMIQLGPWSLVQVLKRISESFNSSILGIRLPVAYDVPTLYDSLENDNVSFEPLQVKKVGPQLFVFLRL